MNNTVIVGHIETNPGSGEPPQEEKLSAAANPIATPKLHDGGHFESLSSSVVSAKPIVGFVKQGEHTPGFCLDDARLQNDPTRLTEPGFKILGIDGGTQAGSAVWNGIKSVTDRRDLTGGYLVELAPDKILQNYAALTEGRSADLSFSPETKRPTAQQAVEVSELIRWLIPGDGDTTLTNIKMAAQLFLRAGLKEQDCLYLFEHGVRVGGGSADPHIAPIDPDAAMPAGFSAKMFNKGFFRNGPFSRDKLADAALRDLRGLSADEVAIKLFDAAAIRDLLPLITALNRTSEQLLPGFVKAFRDARVEFFTQDGCSANARLGMAAVNGLIKLPSDDLLLFTASDAPVMVVRKGECKFFGQLESGDPSKWSVAVEIAENGATGIRPCRAIRYTRISPEDAKDSLIVTMSDGVIPHARQDRALLVGEVGTFSDSAEQLRDFLETFSEARWAYWQERMGKRFPGVDDRFCVVAEGAAYY